jgi:hypothetical protein
MTTPALMQCQVCSCLTCPSHLPATSCPTSHHQVRWAGFSLKQRAWLNITNQRRDYEEQPLLLYTLASNSGVLPAGRQLQLPGFALFGGNSSEQSAPCGLVFPPAIVLCRVRSNTSKHNPPAGASPLMAADGFRDSFPGGCPLLEDAPDLESCTLADLCLLLEEGMLDASSLGQVAADALLHRAMSARDDELLLMLVQADVCLRCSQAALQLLLNYACQVRLQQACRKAATALVCMVQDCADLHAHVACCWLPQLRQLQSTACHVETAQMALRQHQNMHQSISFRRLPPAVVPDFLNVFFAEGSFTAC